MTANQIAYWKMIVDKEHNERLDAETFRSNREREMESKRSNLEKESETKRHNLATEALNSTQVFGNLQIAKGQLALGYESLSETIRHAMAVEDETHRSNVAEEAERTRHNQATEEIQNSGNLLNWGKLGGTTGTLNPTGTVAGISMGVLTTPYAASKMGATYRQRLLDTATGAKESFNKISDSLSSVMGTDSSMYRSGESHSSNPRNPKSRNTKSK